VAAASGFGVASALQYRGARQAQSTSDRMGVSAPAVSALLRSRGWLLGLLADGIATVFQVLALGAGPIAEVQLILVLGLPFSLIVGSALRVVKVMGHIWIAVAVVMLGLGGFLALAQPGDGPAVPSRLALMVLVAVVGVIALALAVGAVFMSSHPGWMAGLLGGGAGVLFAASAALVRACAGLLSLGWIHLVESFSLWALIAVALVGFWMSQAAFRSGPLSNSISVMTIADSIGGVVIGALVLDEPIRHSHGFLAAEVACLIAMGAAVAFMATRSLNDLHPASGQRSVLSGSVGGSESPA
jgi:hypothetical protein